ncbi:alpha/beta hydrolase [Paenibacillus selenitireducens]|uniref:Alpha/beta hydrolase n=1 Tax=Paenibacillus selenitireducens TaxID=1324314 RepID=A0A1T2XJP6_9BACL|nr:alpha/beta hydrolase [Paenibacillus selenitireducens]OPA80111.1 alpha/beta hydrolase [Paenibacillus selenitireducens]
MNITLQTVDLPNGETLGYRVREGGDEVLLLVHGNMNSSQHWDLVMEHIDAKFTVIAIDMRGFGVSTYQTPITSLQDFTADLKMFIDAIGLERFALMGWSTGGGVIMQFAADYPEQVSKLILLASMSTRGYPFFAEHADGSIDVSRRVTTYEDICSLQYNRVKVEANRNRDREFNRMLYNAVIYDRHQPSPERYEAYLDDMLTQRNLMDVYHALNRFNISHTDHEAGCGTGAAARIQAPMLVLWGEHDKVITESMMRELIGDLGDRARLCILENCGHSPLVDDLPQLLKHMEDFL